MVYSLINSIPIAEISFWQASPFSAVFKGIQHGFHNCIIAVFYIAARNWKKDALFGYNALW